MSTLFRGITETVPSPFRGIFSERNSVPNPSCRVTHFENCRLCLDMSSLIQTVIKKNIFVLEANSYFKKLDFRDKKELLRKGDHRHSRGNSLGAVICGS
jgi:hypothetical protein